ncbi:MAG: hypothetical protein [Caudoviricetes sp.]|nr:MAG: hypothetical protein [Caudoviricetes sp.]
MFNMRSILENVQNGQFAGIDMETIPKLRKTIKVEGFGGKTETLPNMFYDNVTKVVTGARVFIGASYEKMVQRRMEQMDIKSGEKFTANKLPWGEHVEGGFPVIKHKDNYYLQVIFDSPGTTQYFFEGRLVDKEEIVGMPAVKPSDESQGGINNKIIIRTISFDSITKIRAAKQEFKAPFCWK